MELNSGEVKVINSLWFQPGEMDNLFDATQFNNLVRKAFPHLTQRDVDKIYSDSKKGRKNITREEFKNNG